MSTGEQPERPIIQTRKEPHRVRLSRFITNGEDVGLGDIAKKATSIVGIRPCGGCAERARRLDNWVAFSAQAVKNNTSQPH